MTRGWMRVGMLVCALAGLSLAPACSSGGGDTHQEQVGSVSMRLTASVNGNTYRLRNALFDVTGPTNTVLDSETNPDATALTATLTSGDYSVLLESGWVLERFDGAAYQQVDATLVSPNPKSFVIVADQVTNVVFQFATNGTVISIGAGDLSLGVSVIENGGSSGSCTNGIQDGDETGVDCGGSACPACLTSECNPGQQTGCPAGESCYVADSNGAGLCAVPGTIPIGQPCTGALNECVSGGACADIGDGMGPICTSVCDLGLNNCPAGQACNPIGIPNLGLCL